MLGSAQIWARSFRFTNVFWKENTFGSQKPSSFVQRVKETVGELPKYMAEGVGSTLNILVLKDITLVYRDWHISRVDGGNG